MSNILKKLLISCVLTVVCLIISAQEATHVYKMSATIQFVVNTDRIIENENYDYYINSIIPEISKNSDNVESIFLIGSASPEGSAAGNVRLSERRAEKIYSHITNLVPKYKVIKSNDYRLFLSKTLLDESDYTKLRATYLEVYFNGHEPTPETKIDTVYVGSKDTLQIEKHFSTHTETVKETVKYEKQACDSTLVMSIYNDLSGDLLKRINIGTEIYFHKFSFFIDGYFSNGTMFGKTYNSSIWHAGFRKYFNNYYKKVFIEIYGHGGYFDTQIFSDNGNFGVIYGGGIGIGYKFGLCTHWKIYPHVRFGIDRIYYNTYYSKPGNVNVSFSNYVDGQSTDGGTNNDSAQTNANVVYNDKKINRNFFDSSFKGVWFGPTFVGITIQRDFHTRK